MEVLLETLGAAALTLVEYCRENEWSGYDPYDALNSRVLASVPLGNARLTRLAFTQALKRSPLNFRALLAVPKTENPKAIALFLMAFLKLAAVQLSDRKELVALMAEKLAKLRSQGSPYWCWGYSFPWQTRTILVPRGAPNLVCTVFVADGLLDLYESDRNSRYLDMAVSAAQYLLNDLYWTDNDSTASFSYPVPMLRTRVHNANFLAAALLCRVFAHSGDERFLAPALRVARYSVSRQHGDGSWDYGEAPSQRWADNFHTGYNLCALRSIAVHAKTSEFDSSIGRGFAFYRTHFFTEDGAARYFHDRIYPIDIHSVAQSIITLVGLRDLGVGSTDLAVSVARWAMAHLRDEQGYFYYRRSRFHTNTISYMRWSQAWMLLALATLLEHCPSAATATLTAEKAACARGR